MEKELNENEATNTVKVSVTNSMSTEIDIAKIRLNILTRLAERDLKKEK